jgi:uncharacterized membrane protein
MENNEFLRNLKIIVVLAVIIGLIVAAFYLIYGFALFWQAIAATIIIGILSILVIVFTVLSIYFWSKNLLLKREVKKYHLELNHCRAEINKIKETSNKVSESNKSED